MKPKKSSHYDLQKDLFRVELYRIVDLSHGLIKQANVVDWDRLDEFFGSAIARRPDGPQSVPA